MVSKQTKPIEKPTHERIEFATLYGIPDPHTPGELFPPYMLRDHGSWQSRVVTTKIGKLLREFSRRGRHGVSLKKVDPDDLAELNLIGVPYKLTDWDRSNHWAQKKLFAVIDVVLRFAEDGAAQQTH